MNPPTLTQENKLESKNNFAKIVRFSKSYNGFCISFYASSSQKKRFSIFRKFCARQEVFGNSLPRGEIYEHRQIVLLHSANKITL